MLVGEDISLGEAACESGSGVGGVRLRLRKGGGRVGGG